VSKGIKVIVGASSHYAGAVRISKLLYEYISEKSLRDVNIFDRDLQNNIRLITPEMNIMPCV